MKKRIISLLLASVMALGMVLQLAPSAQAAVNVTVTDSAGVNMRDGAGTSYNKVIGIPVNTVLSVQETESADGYTWGKVTYDGKTGWIALEFTNYDASQAEPTPPASNGTWKQEGGKWYYYINGQKATGWVFHNNRWYYLDNAGVMQTGWVKLSEKWYYLESSGVMATGWVLYNGYWYFMNGKGVMQTGWITDRGYSYYLDEYGRMQTGWLQQGDVWYYLQDGGKMATGRIRIGDKIAKFDAKGKWLGYSKYMTSQSCIDVLKLEEGFSLVPYWDFTQWTVGYGTRCPDDLLDYYKQNGITVAEAETLLREYLMDTEASIESFIDRYSLDLSAQQFDALVLFSYNCGSSWVSETTGTFHTAIKNGATGSELIRAFVLWSSAGGEIKDFLIRRRMSEANMYLNGVYSQTPPDHYGYVLYDANGGSVSFRIQGFDAKEGVAPYTPTHATQTFDGWYTAKEGGTKVTSLTMAQNGKTLYARWKDPNATTPSEPQTPPETTTKTSVLTVQTEDGPLNVRQGPGVEYDKVTTLNDGAQVILLETRSVGSYVWGRYESGWIRLDYTNYDPSQHQSANGWVQMTGKWYYFSNGQKATNWQKINNYWYYFGSNGVMQTGWVNLDNSWYYLQANGVMHVGWLQYKNVWYYLQESGVMATGWVKTNDKWYYLNADGIMQTGWLQLAAGWYYLQSNGVMHVGWLQYNNRWYYMHDNGIMRTGWVQSNSHWYYLSDAGVMQTGWVEVKGKWYYLNGNGTMYTGWLQYKNCWYYLQQSGVMATGTVAIGPVTYKFDANGIWLG